MTTLYPRQDLDAWLDQVDYTILNTSKYVPSDFSLTFMNIIKAINGTEGESHNTPPLHLKMLDKVITPSQYIANLVFRGAAKTTLFMEYLSLYLGIFHYIPGFGSVSGMIYVSDSIDNGVKLARQNIEFRYDNSDFLKKWIPYARFTEKYIEFKNVNGEQLGIRLYGALTGIRGSKVFGKRPVLAVLDDLLSDEDANSPAALVKVNDTIYKGVINALDPSRFKIIYNGTPFNKQDPLVQAVESGGWDVNVWPVCERFPCEREEFIGAWPDRFTYDDLMTKYKFFESNGKLPAFYQELMLRITNDEDRLVQDEEIRWYTRDLLLKYKQNYNFYITTDFATSEKQTSDYSVISVWAYGSGGDWFWVDGICVRQTMDKNIDKLFEYVSEYSPQQVGVEVTGQQKAFISWLQREMINRNIWFNFASSEKSGEPGIRPITSKLSRFNLVVPWFKAGKIYFPEELKNTPVVKQFIQQIRLVTSEGIKGKDDCLDTVSMLGYLKPFKPSDMGLPTPDGSNTANALWYEEEEEEVLTMSSYIV